MPTRNGMIARRLKKIDRFPEDGADRMRSQYSAIRARTSRWPRVDLVGDGPHAHVADDRCHFGGLPGLLELVVDRDRGEERVQVRVLGVREAQFHRRRQAVVAPDERPADSRLHAQVVVPVHAQDERLHVQRNILGRPYLSLLTWVTRRRWVRARFMRTATVSPDRCATRGIAG